MYATTRYDTVTNLSGLTDSSLLDRCRALDHSPYAPPDAAKLAAASFIIVAMSSLGAADATAVVVAPSEREGTSPRRHLIGYAAVRLAMPSAALVVEEAYLLAVCVDPAQRGQGVGGALLDAVFAAMRQQGLKRLRLHTRVDSTEYHWYLKSGFVVRRILRNYYPATPAVTTTVAAAAAAADAADMSLTLPSSP